MNFFELEPILIAALRAALPASVKVGSAASIVGRQDMAALCPAVFVLPGDALAGPEDDDPDADDAITVEEGIWTAVVLDKFLRDTTTLDANFSAVGALMGLVYDTLHGLRAPGHRTLTYAGRQQPAPTEHGVVEFAVDFTVVRAFEPA